MANKRVRDAAGSVKYVKTTGDGTDADPFMYTNGGAFVLTASSAKTVDGIGDAVDILGKWDALMVLCEFTLKATEVGDTCDVYVDFLVDASWINAIHFTQALGNGTDAQKEYAVIVPRGTNTAVTEATANLASAAVRGDVFGSKIRARWVIVDVATLGNQSFSFSVTGYAQ